VLVLGSGKERHGLRNSIGDHDLVVTNYALLRRDIESWRNVELHTAILDERQNIKNPDGGDRGARVARRHRLALTGTPLENRAPDLWSILSFTNPGYLGSRLFQRPLRPRRQCHARALLSSRGFRPVLVRRTKQEVTPELPDRIEERVDCEMTKGQRQLYLAELKRSRRLLEDMARDPEELRRNRITILAALTRLRQICCHPTLAGGRSGLGSGKFETLFELLEPLLAEGHKVLVFSQFVECLKLLAEEMRNRELPFHMLTGQTTRRERVVDAFENDTRASAFLISLKAGGTGLNLTSASYVVVFDPWWNPAVEAQAIDRTHRIGQTRTVIAYRLLTRGTIEERIFDLQQRKAQMVRDVLGETGFARALTRADLEFLLTADDEDE
jgi:SNF2 family DNA or RNA helicase